MTFNKLVLFILLNSLTLASSFAVEICAECNQKNVTGLPDIGNSKLLAALADDTPPTVPGKSPFANYIDGYCMKFAQITRNEVASFTREMEASPYSIDKYFQTSACRQEAYGGKETSPMLHLVADDPATKVDYLGVIYRYYTIKRKDESLWFAAINSKNTQGETLLDYFEFNIRRGTYHLQRPYADQVIAYLCAHGGVYSKFKDEKKCPPAN